LYVNLTPDGSLDKTMLEAMASGVPVLVSNSAFKGVIPAECQTDGANTPEAIAGKIHAILSFGSDEKREIGEKLRRYAEDAHSLEALAGRIVKELSSDE
jgi:glycosyltransferase involved in cell wall biosynthesis